MVHKSGYMKRMFLWLLFCRDRERESEREREEEASKICISCPSSSGTTWIHGKKPIFRQIFLFHSIKCVFHSFINMRLAYENGRITAKKWIVFCISSGRAFSHQWTVCCALQITHSTNKQWNISLAPFECSACRAHIAFDLGRFTFVGSRHRQQLSC